MTIIEQIKDEIERRKELLTPHKGQGVILCREIIKQFDSLLSFIYTISQPIMKDDIIDEIRAEIERRFSEYNHDSNHHIQAAECASILDFLSTLESEKTISPWKKIHTYTEELHEGDMEKMLLELSVGKGEKRTKIAFPDRIIDILESEKPMGLEEEAVSYCFDNGLNLTPRVATDFARHFAQWGAEHTPLPEDTVLFNKGVAEGKRLMMEEAVDATVHLEPGANPVIEISVGRFGLKVRDKVRVIVLKKED